MDTEEKLIKLVEQCECLYNLTCRKYNDKHTKQKAWRIISRDLGIPAKECMIRWKRLRENYSKAVKKREDKCGAGALRPYKYEKEMAFVKPYLGIHTKTRDKIKLMKKSAAQDTFSEANTANEDFHSDTEPNEVPTKVTNNIAEILQNLVESRQERHPIDAFFSAMAVNVKKLPIRLQLEVKNKVFSAVTEAELKSLNESAPEGFNMYAGDYCANPSYVAPCRTSQSTILYPSVKSEQSDHNSESN